MDKKYIPTFLLDTDDDGSIIYETSLVEDPATGASFLYFNNNQVFSNQDSKYRRILSGVWMMPDVDYPRVDMDGNKYYVRFTPESLRKSLEKHIESGKADTIYQEHSNKAVEAINVEYWIIRDENTLSPIYGLSMSDLGYTNLPIGTVLKSVKILDEDYWNNYILTNKVVGFSIGGLFNLSEISVKETLSSIEQSIKEEFQNDSAAPSGEVIEASPTTDVIAEENTETTHKNEVIDGENTTENTNINPNFTKELDELRTTISSIREEIIKKDDEITSYNSKLEQLNKELTQYKEQNVKLLDLIKSKPIKDNDTSKSESKPINKGRHIGGGIYI